MTIKKSVFFSLNFVMFFPWRHRRCLKADPCLQRHLTAKLSNRMLMSLSHWSPRNGVAPLAMPRRWRTVLKKPSEKDSVIEGQPLLLFM
jgi:hypothetical protein